MDEKTRREIFACARPGCGLPEDAHKNPVGTDAELLGALTALGGACDHYVLSDRALQYQAHLNIAGRDPAPRYGGPRPKRGRLCGRCGQRGHKPENCVISPGTPGRPPESIRNRNQ
jgi:hypothetical protein